MDPFRSLSTWSPPVAAAIVRSDGSVDAAGDPAAAFPLASVTKLITALGIHVAIEEGTLALDEPAGPPGATVADLLAHASGLGPGPGPPLAPPRQRRIYSNEGYRVLAGELERRAGLPWPTYLAEAVLEPLAMTGAAIDDPAAGGRASVDDLVALVRALWTPAIVSDETIRRLRAPHLPDLAGVLPGFGRHAPNPWSLGPERRGGKHPHWTGTANSPETYGHFGQSGTFVWIDPLADVALVCLTTRPFGDWAITAWPALSDAVLGAA